MLFTALGTQCRGVSGYCNPSPKKTLVAQPVYIMLQAGDAAHKQAMDAMLQLSQAGQEKWYGEFVAGFAALPDA